MKGGLLFRGWKTLTSRGFFSLNDKSLRVCVIGSGPAGFYTAEKVPTVPFLDLLCNLNCKKNPAIQLL